MRLIVFASLNSLNIAQDLLNDFELLSQHDVSHTFI